MPQLANNPMRVVVGDVPVTLFKHWAQIHHFEFQKAAAADTVTVTDLLGNHVWDVTVGTNNDNVISQLIGDVYGLIVSAMASAAGELLIYFR